MVEPVIKAVESILSRIFDVSEEKRIDDLKIIWNYCDVDEHRKDLCKPHLSLLPTLVRVLETFSDDRTVINATGCFWYLSRNNDARKCLGAADNQIIPVLMKILQSTKNSDIIKQIEATLSNCSLAVENCSYLLKPDFGYLQYLKTILLDRPQAYESIKCLRNLIDNVTNPHDVQTIFDLDVHGIIFNRLCSYGTPKDPKKANDYVRYWSFMFLLSSSHFAIFSSSLSGFDNFYQFFQDLIEAPDMDSIKSAIILANVYGREEKHAFNTHPSSLSSLKYNSSMNLTTSSAELLSSNVIFTKSLLQSHENILSFLLDLFCLIISYDETCDLAKEYCKKGFNYGVIEMKDISSALRNLSISDENKGIMIQGLPRLLPILAHSIKLFIDNQPECCYKFPYGIEYSGGGGKDMISLENMVECLLQLSFYFEDDEILRNHYVLPAVYSFANHSAIYHRTPLTIASVLQELIELPRSRNLSFEVKQWANTLLHRLMPRAATSSPTRNLPRPPPSDSQETSKNGNNNNIKRPQHVMISYSWGAKKSYVVSFAKKLQENGYDVWRDEEGSSLVGPMSGDIVERMAEAIQNSYAMIIFVSPQYKESINCRSEAKYARACGLKLIYIMLDSMYTTVSAPSRVDGWLGFMIGSELWYPLWQESHFQTTLKEVMQILGDNALKLDNCQSILSPPPSQQRQEQEQHQEQLPEKSTSSSSVVPPTVAPSPVSSSSSVVVTAPDVQAPPAVVPRDGSAASNVIQQGPPAADAPRDFATAWQCLQAKKTICPNSFPGLLEELGIETVEDFEKADEEYWRAFIIFLKPIHQKTYKQAMRFL